MPFSLQTESVKNEYEKLFHVLINISEPILLKQTPQGVQFRLSEIQQLVRMNDDTFEMVYDEFLKHKIRCHIMFLKALTTSVNKILEKEALDQQIEYLQDTQAMLKFKELTTQEQEERNIAFLNLSELINKERNFALYSMVTIHVDIVTITIVNLKEIKKDIKVNLASHVVNFQKDLKYKLQESSLFQHLSDNELDEMNDKLHKLCDEIDARFLNRPAGKPLLKEKHITQMQNFGIQPTGLSDLELAKAIKKNKKVVKFLKKHHQSKYRDALVSPLSNLPKINKLAKEAIKLHDSYVTRKHELEHELELVKNKIDNEERKKQKCLQQLEYINPEKREQYKKTIEKSYSRLESKYIKQKEFLEKKISEKQAVDSTILAMHPEALKEPPPKQPSKSQKNIFVNTQQKLKSVLTESILNTDPKPKSEKNLKGKSKGKEN